MIRNKIQNIDNDSIKLKDDEDINFFDFGCQILFKTNQDKEIKDHLHNESNLVISDYYNNIGDQIKNLKVYRNFSNQQSELSRFNAKIINYTNNLKIAKKKKFSHENIRKSKPNNGSFPSLENITNDSINFNKRNIDISTLWEKNLNNTVNRRLKSSKWL